ncbi:MAG: Nitroreductase [Candidatus Falkowbacteria bacterium GW2011_GWA2_39_24]|uniref:Nitroreductase n=1 Tax=Candidatus Falkowbacteria bacterium GW2011_GWA2_39_24 TaxID=1618634 RepID=A0A0G0QWU9_9BACT|nr:MAG: Nitroreductase [Candidatus Falkowbacteria bacterium GW2011_GWA2_39_24]
MQNIRLINPEKFSGNNDLQEHIKFVLNYAILAPSTHNSQPWLFKIKTPECHIYYDPKLLLPEADPKTRDLHISIGCAIENLILVAIYFNIFDSVNYGPFENKEQLVTIHFKKYTGTKNNEYKRLLDTITKRINARGSFSSKPVPTDLINLISSTTQHYLAEGINTHWITDKDKITRLSMLTAEGLKTAYRYPSFRKEMSHWMHHSLTKNKDGLPGYALRIPLLLSFVLPTLVKWFDLGSLLSKLNYKSLNSAPLVVIITAAEDNQITWLKVGRFVERLMLEFNSFGWQTSIFVAAVEMGCFQNEIQKVIGTNQIPQFLFVVGKIDSLHQATPRHELIKKIIS